MATRDHTPDFSSAKENFIYLYQQLTVQKHRLGTAIFSACDSGFSPPFIRRNRPGKRSAPYNPGYSNPHLSRPVYWLKRISPDAHLWRTRHPVSSVSYCEQTDQSTHTVQ